MTVRIVLAVAARSTAPTADRAPLRAVDEAANRAFGVLCPWRADFTEFERRWASPERRTLVRLWSNEPEHPTLQPGWQATAHGVVCWSGLFGAATPPGLARSLTRGPDHDLHIADAPGIFAFFAATDDGVAAFTNVHRANSVFWAQDADFVYLGTHASLVHLVASRSLRPTYDPLGVASLICAGHPTTEGTPFAGVTSARPGEVARLRTGHPFRRTPLPAASPPDDVDAVAAMIAERLVASCVTEAAGASDIRASVTGGKDSRLVVAALHAGGLSFSTSTTGFPEHPDVRIGREIARLLDVPHQIYPPRTGRRRDGGQALTVNPVRRTWNCLRRSDGMLSSYSNSVDGQFPFRPGPATFNGVGGELLRGGLAHGWGGRPAARLHRAMDYLLLAEPWILTPGMRRRYDAATDVWRQRSQAAPMQALADYHRIYRTGRWAAAGRHGPSLLASTSSVLMDNAMIRVVVGLPVSELHDERLVARVLGKLNPTLQRFVFCAQRWDFERERPAGILPAAEWADRAPLPMVSERRSGFNWRLSYGAEVAAFFRRELLADGSSALFDIVDRDAVSAVLNADKPAGRLVWRLYSAHFLLSNSWLDPTAPAGGQLSVPVPTA
ncbi:MAG: hypothetical protein DLM56_14700 [Pseudonocardiales bacterium]|nr:MAG: hypothetical protein DLM56_14700 [Pseudonocardiales bacterium]